MAWLSLLSGVLKLASWLAKLVNDRQLMDAGEQRGVAKSLAEIIVATDTAAEVDAHVAGLTDAQVDEELEGDFRT